MNKDDRIHGSMFLLLKKFIESSYDHHAWIHLNNVAGTNPAGYLMYQSYPVSEMYSILAAASQYTRLTQNDLKERFGEFLVPDLLQIYKPHINPAWKTFEMLLNTERVMHKVARRDNQASPPVLNVMKVSDHQLIIDYYSERKMASMAVGIIKGIAKYFSEGEKIRVTPVTNLDEPRVQIKVEALPD